MSSTKCVPVKEAYRVDEWADWRCAVHDRGMPTVGYTVRYSGPSLVRVGHQFPAQFHVHDRLWRLSCHNWGNVYGEYVLKFEV